MGTNEENIIENFVVLSKVEPEPDLKTGSGSDQKVPVPVPTGSATLVADPKGFKFFRRIQILPYFSSFLLQKFSKS